MQFPGMVIISVLLACLICLTGCTSTSSPVETPAPRIIYVTVLVTPAPVGTSESATVSPALTKPSVSVDEKMDEAFTNYIFEHQILEGMIQISSTSEGQYSAKSGYNAKAKEKAENLTALLVNAPKPGSEKLKAFRSAMMDAIAMMDGTTAGFSRYREAMQKVTETKFAALSEMPSLESFSVEPTQFRGYGNTIQSFNSTGTGKKYFTITHNGKSNFAIVLKDESDRYISLLANQIGSYSAKRPANLTMGKYYLDVTADGAWTIDITSV
jgi:hypothetical protein